MADQAKNIMIGLFVIVACGIAVLILLFLHPSVGNNEKTLRVLFTDIDKVTIGTRVTFAGKPVGEVAEIREIPTASTHRVPHDGSIYVYELILKVDSSVNVYNVDSISVRTSGLLGEKNIAISPGSPLPDEPIILINNKVIYAEQTGGVEETFKEFSKISDKLERVLDQVSLTFQKIEEEKIWDRAGGILKNLNDITEALNKPEIWSGILDNFYQLSARLPKSWNIVDMTLHNLRRLSKNALDKWPAIDKSIDDINFITDNFKKISTTGHEIIFNLNQGEGAFSKLLNNPDLYLHVQSLISKGELIMDDIENFGVLFQLNKGWQRLHARRLNLLNRLRTPDEFQDYFNCQVDQISTSLSEVSMVLREIEAETDSDCAPCLLSHPAYSDRYSELLRRIKEIEESLQMYNQQAIDACKGD